MKPALHLVLRPEFAADPVARASLGVQQGKDAPRIQEGNGGGVAPGVGGDTKLPDGPVPDRGNPMGQCLDPTTLIMFGGMFLVLYFFVIRPQKKQEQARQALLASLKKGDKVVTNAGIHGVILTVGDQTVQVQVDTVEMTMDRSAIGRVVRNEGAAPAS